VRIAEESAVIVWDPMTNTEHFIRSAAFDTDAADFGFLVPTPTVPKLTEADEYLFTTLEYRMRPEVVTQSRISGVDLTPLILYPFMLLNARSGASETGVHVVNSQQVAGYDAVVLKANDAAELNGWLNDHGYASTPSLTEWLKPYVSNGWAITAFKIAKKNEQRAVSTSAVRMSFTTDRPFFPYREPADQRASDQQGGRLLRVFFFGGSRMDGSLGDSANWPGKTVWADKIGVNESGPLGDVLLSKGQFLAPDTWMTVFEDTSSPRPGTDDVYFKPAAQQAVVHPDPVIKTVDQPVPLPLDILLIFAAIVGIAFLLFRRRKRRISLQ
jgi:hypothetical protein